MVDPPPQPADDKAGAKQRRPDWKRAGAGLLALSLLVILLLACVLWIPKWLYPPLNKTDLQNVSDAAKVQEIKGARLKLQNDARTSLLQGIGALLVLTGAAIGASVTLRQVQATRDQMLDTAKGTHEQLKLSNAQLELSNAQLKLSEQGQVTDRYTKAIDQLGDDKALAVRLGGLYALERIAHDSPKDRATIAEVLCAYVRTAPRSEPPSRRTKDSRPSVTGAVRAGPSVAYRDRLSLAVRAPDVQAAVTILGRWRERLNEPPPVLDLHKADLECADLTSAQLQRADLTGAKLQGAFMLWVQLQDAFLGDAEMQEAHLDDANLEGADLEETKLQRASLVNANLQGVNGMDAQLQGARLLQVQMQDAGIFGAQLQGADLTAAQLRNTGLGGAQLQGAILTRAQLQRADLTDTHLEDANLDGAHLDGAMLEGAQASAGTRWPDGWDRARVEAAGVQFVDFEGSLVPEKADVRSPDEPTPPGED